MTLKTRRRLLYLLVFAFFIIGTSAALYAQGYRLDPKDMSFQKVGGIYIRSFPKAAVYVDGDLVKSDYWFFQNGFLVNDLFPRKYNISIYHSDYEDWKQTVTVKPALVSEIKFAVLIPKKKSEALATKDIQNFWVGEKGLITYASGTLMQGLNKIPGTRVVEEERESNRILTVDDKQGTYFIYDYDSNTSSSVTRILRSADLPVFKNVMLDVGENEIIAWGKREIHLVNISSLRSTEISRISTSTIEISPLTISSDNIAWTQFNAQKNSAELIVYNKNRRTRTSYNTLFSGKTRKIEWRGSRLALLQDTGELFYGDPLQNSMEKITSGAKDFAYTENNVRVAVLGEKMLELIPLRNFDAEEYLKFEISDISKIKDMQWYQDNRHLFLSFGDRTMFLDIDDELLEHYYQIGTAKSRYDQKNNYFFYLDSGSLWRLDLVE